MGIMANFLSHIPSLVISIATALVTVASAFWLREKQNKVDTLRAVVTEIEQNEIHGEGIVCDLFESRDGFNHPGEDRTVPPFQTSAYEHLKDSGLLSQLPENVKSSVHAHYSIIKRLNRRVEQRQSAQLITSSTNQRNKQVSIDKSVFNLLLRVFSPEGMRVTAASLQGNEAIEDRLRNEFKSREKQVGEERTHTFDGVKDFLDNAIEETNIRGYF